MTTGLQNSLCDIALPLRCPDAIRSHESTHLYNAVLHRCGIGKVLLWDVTFGCYSLLLTDTSILSAKYQHKIQGS